MGSVVGTAQNPRTVDTTGVCGGVDSTLSWFWTRQEWGSGQGPFPAWAGLREMQGVRVRVRPGGAAV